MRPVEKHRRESIPEDHLYFAGLPKDILKGNADGRFPQSFY
jgi:hypothetical protein